jgi:hypothetical protein
MNQDYQIPCLQVVSVLKKFLFTYFFKHIMISTSQKHTIRRFTFINQNTNTFNTVMICEI